MPDITRLDLTSFRRLFGEGGHQVSAFQLALKAHELLTQGLASASKTSRRVDFLFHDFRACSPGFGDLLEGLSSLNDFLFRKKNFTMIETTALGSDGIFLAKVIESRRGDSLTLGLLYREMIRKMNLGPADFASVPGIMAVKVLFNHQLLIINAGDGGKLLPVADLRGRGGVYLQTPTEIQIITGFLSRLKACYFKNRNWPGALAVLDLLLFVAPGKMAEFRERGLLLYQLGMLEEAHKDLRHYMANCRPSEDTENLRKLLTHL